MHNINVAQDKPLLFSTLPADNVFQIVTLEYTHEQEISDRFKEALNKTPYRYLHSFRFS